MPESPEGAEVDLLFPMHNGHLEVMMSIRCRFS
jgi:hypothetical protein